MYIHLDLTIQLMNILNNIYRGKSPITDPLLIPTPSRISVTIRDIKKIYTLTVSNLMIPINKYFV